MDDNLRRFSKALKQFHDRSRLLAFGEYHPKTVRLYGLASDPQHFDLAKDAIETHWPGARVETETGSPNGEAVHLLLHPWPYLNETIEREFQPVKRRFYNARWRAGKQRSFVLFRNLELWRANPRDALLRRALQPLFQSLDRRCARRDDAVLDREVFPALETLRTAGARPRCEHERARAVFQVPRRIRFCPDCGIGFSSIEDQRACAPDLYGEAYATGGRFAGMREFIRYSREQGERVKDYFGSLGFSIERPGSEKPSVLDFGCGNGRFAHLFAEAGWLYAGIDTSEENIRFARSLAESMGVQSKCRFISGEFARSPLSAERPWDFIFLSHVLEHVEAPRELLAMLRRHTNAGGHLYIEVPNALDYTWSQHHRGYRNVEHLWDFTPDALMQIVTDAGWREAKVSFDPDRNAYPYIALLAVNSGKG